MFHAPILSGQRLTACKHGDEPRRRVDRRKAGLVPHRGGAGLWRHGGRLSRDERKDGKGRRDQGHGRRVCPERQDRAPVRARSRDPPAITPSQHRPVPGVGQVPRHVVHRDGVRAGRDGGKNDPGPRAPAVARGGRAGNPDLRGTPLCARARRRPPRFEAVKPDGHGRRQDQAGGFRDRQGPRRDGADGHRQNAGNGGLHVSRADPRHPGRQPQDRPLRARGRLVSDAGRQAAVRGNHAGRADALPLERAPAEAQCQAGGDPQEAGRAHRVSDGQVAHGPALGLGRRGCQVDRAARQGRAWAPVAMVWPSSGPAAANPPAPAPPSKPSAPPSLPPNAPGRKKAKPARHRSSRSRSDVEGGSSWINRSTVETGLLALALVAIGGFIAYLVWPPSDEYLFKHAEALMASARRADWNTALDEYINPLDERFQRPSLPRTDPKMARPDLARRGRKPGQVPDQRAQDHLHANPATMPNESLSSPTSWRPRPPSERTT